MSVGISENGDVLIKCMLCEKATAVKINNSDRFKCNGMCSGDNGCGCEFTFKYYDENGRYLHPNFRKEYLIILKNSKQK